MMESKYTNVFLSRVKRYRVLFILTLAFTLVLMVIIQNLSSFYPKIIKRLRGAACDATYDVENFPNREYLLTNDHDIGRLGNKIFKYASLLGIAKREGRTPFVRRYAEEMETLFKLTHVKDYPPSFTDGWPVIKDTQYAYFDPVFLNLTLKNLSIIGCLQSWKYFQDIEEHVRQEFRLSDKMKSEADQIMNSIRQNFNATEKAVLVGVHVRRIDGYSEKNTLEAPKSFFINAFDIMKSLFPGQRVIFVVAGNEMNWCRENLAGDDVTILEDASRAVHFAVLSSCQHFIVSIGSFGWWTGWLTGGRVIFYKKFPQPHNYEFIGFNYKDYYPPSWIPVGD